MSTHKFFMVRSVVMEKKPAGRDASIVRLPAKARNRLSLSDDDFRNTLATLKAVENADASVEVGLYISYMEDIRSHRTQFPRLDLKDTLFAGPEVFRALGLGDREAPIEVILDTNEDKFLIGADPEFGLFDDTGRLIPARQCLEHMKALGSDGVLAEVRPAPAYTPAQLVNNINALFNHEENVRNIMPYIWRAICFHKSTRSSAGGHIHIGNVKQVEEMSYIERKAFAAIMNKILDEKLGVLLVRFDGEEEGSSRRVVSGYGGFGGFRFNEGHLEYRTPSGLWLSHPSLAFSVIGTAYAVAEEIYNLCRANSFNATYIMPGDIVPLIYNDCWTEAYDLLYRKNYDGWSQSGLCRDIDSTRASFDIKNILLESKPSWVTKSVVRSWHAHMKNLSTYSKHEVSIGMLGEFLSIPLEKLEKMNTNLRETWLEAKPFIYV